VALVTEVPDDDPFRSNDTMAAHLEGKELEVLVSANQELLLQLQRKLAANRIATVISVESEENRAMRRFMLLCLASDIDEARSFFGDEWGQSVAAEGLQETVVESENCPACGSPVPATEEECPECGLFVGRLEE
jgi:hypothetical protein